MHPLLWVLLEILAVPGVGASVSLEWGCSSRHRRKRNFIGSFSRPTFEQSATMASSEAVDTTAESGDAGNALTQKEIPKMNELV